MSAPLIWILFPAVLALALLPLQSHRRVITGIAAVVAVLLAGLALLIPLDSVITLGSLRVSIPGAMNVLGRRLVLNPGDRYLIALAYGLGGFWFLGSSVARTHHSFPSLGMMMIALLLASLAVEPFLYAALLVEMAVLITIPMMVPPGSVAGQGVQRYLIFQTLAVPFILLAAWVMGSNGGVPGSEAQVLQAVLLLGLGFAFWLAVFPFYTWVPLLAGEVQPYVAGFVLSILPAGILVLMLHFFDNYGVLRSVPNLFPGMRLIGVLMVVTGGVWAAFQDDLARIFGYAVIVETGFALIAVGLLTDSSMAAFTGAALPRMLALALWSLAMTVLRQRNIDLSFGGIQGTLRRFPFAFAAIVFPALSLSGMPILPGFTPRTLILSSLAEVDRGLTLWALVGMGGLLFSVLRAMAAAAQGGEGAWQVEETPWQRALLIPGLLVLLLMGLFPGVLLSNLIALLDAFQFIR